ncbi:MAG: hypothetical protein JO326_11660, partial [Acetobacteraceae bacterium]|nr:hypothetical protein [Acetobacteraceae bacterium]
MLLTRLPFERLGASASAGEAAAPPPTLAACERIDLHRWIAAIACLDVAGA